MAVNPITSESLTLDFKSLMKVPVGDRVKAAAYDQAFLQSILSALTPIQVAQAFPDYFRRQLPDVSNFITSNIVARNGGNFNQTGGGSGGSSYPYYDGETKPLGTASPAGTPQPTIEEMKKKLLEKGIDVDGTLNLVKQGAILEGDERAAALKKMSDEELKAVGLQRTQDESGKTLIQMAPSRYEGMSETQVLEEYKKTFPKTNVSPRERATLDFIAKREGAKDPNIIFGDIGGRPGSGKYSQQLKAMGYTKPLTEMTIAEVRAMQKDLIALTGGKIGKGDLGTSAVGSGQMIGSTLETNLKALGIPPDQWDKVVFTKDLQDQLTLQNFKTMGIGDPNAPPSTWNHAALGQQYESLDTSKHPPMSQQEMAEIEGKSSVRPEAKDDITSQEALRKLQEAESVGYGEELTRRLYNQASPTSSEYVADTSSPKFTVLKGNIEEVDPRLQSVISAASGDLPTGYTVKAISGKDSRTTGTKNHPAGIAMDVQIYDNEGKLVPHNSNSPGWKYYEMLYRSAHIRGQEMYPDQKFIWGGAWISDAAGRGDPMHYQIVDPSVQGSSQSSGRYSFESGLDPSHPFAAEGGQLTADEREAYDSTIRKKIEKEKEERKKQEQTVADSSLTPSAPTDQAIPQKALGGNLYGLNEDITLVNTKTGEPIAQVNDGERLIKEGSSMQVVPESKIKAEELNQQIDTTRQEPTQEEQPQNSNQLSQVIKQQPVQNDPDKMWREKIAAGHREDSPSYIRAMTRTKFGREGNHFNRSAPGSQS